MGPDTDTADSGFDLDSAVAEIGTDLGFSSSEPDEPDEPDDAPGAKASAEQDEPEGAEQGETETEGTEKPATEQPTAKEAPKSWPKEKHAIWQTLPPEAQDFYLTREKQFLDGLEQYKAGAQYAKQLSDVVAPFRPLLQQQGINETEAFQYMLTAHANLSTGSPEQRRESFMQIGRDLGILGANDTTDTLAVGEQLPVDPRVQELQQRLNALESERNRETQARLQRVKVEADTAVEAFAADPENIYFNEVASDMALLVKQGFELKDAYDRAVWSNPVTRAKEQARLQTEAAETAKKAAQEQLQTARRPAATNVRGVESRRAPTEPKGKFLSDESLMDDLKRIKARQAT